MADTNYNPQDEEFELFDDWSDEEEDNLSSFDDAPDEEEDNLSSFDDAPDETDDNEEPEQADYNSSDDTPNDPNQESVNSYEEAKKEFEAEAENAAKWSLAEFAQKDEGYAMFLDTLVKAYGIDPNQNMQAIIMQLNAKGCSLPQKAAELLINNNAATADKSFRCLEAGCGGENINSSKYSVSTITKPALDITLKTIEAFFACKNISADSASLATSVGFAVGGDLAAYEKLLSEVLKLTNQKQGTTDTDDNVQVPFQFQASASDCQTVLDALYERAIISVKTGLIATVGGRFACLYVDENGTIQKVADYAVLNLLDGLKNYALNTIRDGDSVILEPADDLVGVNVTTKKISELFQSGKRSNILAHLCFMYGWYYDLDTKAWAHSNSYSKAMKKSVAKALAYYWFAIPKDSNAAMNDARSNCQACALLLDCSSVIHSWLVVDRPTAHSKKSIYNAILELSKKPDESVMIKVFASSTSSFKLLTEATDEIAVNGDTKGYSFAYTPNDEGYQQQILFGYMAVDRRAQAGVLPSISNVLLGRTLAGKDVSLDLTKSASRFMFVNAASRSGKGVMTLSILGTAIACGIPFVYVDGKPDMAFIFWELERDNPGSRILAVDILAATKDVATEGYGTNAKLTPNWGNTEEPARIANAKARSLSCKAYDSIIDKNGVALGVELTEAKKRKLMQMVLTYKVLILKEGIKNWCSSHSTREDVKRAIFVLDEINNVTLKTTGEDNIPCTVADFARLPTKLSTSSKKNKTPEELAEEAEQKAFVDKLNKYIATWRHLLSYIGFMMPAVLTTGNTVWSDVTSNPPPYDRAASELANADSIETYVNTLVIGQSTGMYNDDKATPRFTGLHKGAVVHQSAFKPIFDANANYVTLIRGRGANKHLKGASSDSAYVDGTKTDTRGYFNIQESCSYSSTPSKINVIKSYLTLNANDINSPNPEFVSTFVVDAVKRSYSNADEILHNPAIGFVGYMQHLYKVALGKDLSTAELAKQCSLGYDLAEAVLTSLGILGAGNPFGYTTVEDWLYDINPDSLVDIDMFTTAAGAGTKIDFAAIHAAWAGRGQTNDNTEGNNEEPVFDWGSGGGQPTTQTTTPTTTSPTPTTTSPTPTTTSPTSTTTSPTSTTTPTTPPMSNKFDIEEHTPTNLDITTQSVSPIGAGTGTTETSYGPQNAGDSTQNATAYKLDDAYQAQMDMGTPSDNPFVVYKGKGKHLREAISNMLVKHLRRMAGGSDKGSLDAITSFVEEDGRIIVNNMPFVPTLDPSLLYCVPTIMKKDIAQGRWAAFLNLNVLTKMKNLRSVSIKDPDIADCVWEDLGIPTYNTDKLRKKLKKCREFIIGGIDILKEDEGNTSNKKEPSENVKKVMDKSKMSNFANALGAALGIEGCSSDNHPVLSALGKSKGMRAMKFGALIGTATWVGSLLFAAANPFLIIGGLFTAGAYIKNCKDEAKKQSK